MLYSYVFCNVFIQGPIVTFLCGSCNSKQCIYDVRLL